MISKQTIAELGQSARTVHFILGARMHLVKEGRQIVASDRGPYEQVHGPKTHSQDPSPLEVKEVKVGSHRYVVCRNADQAKKDREDRQAIVAHLRDQLKQGDKSLVGNQGYRKYLKTTGASRRFEVDEDKIRPIFDTMKLQFLAHTGVAHLVQALGTTPDPMKLLLWGSHEAASETARTTGPRATPAACSA
jgi:hypothetical protein